MSLFQLINYSLSEVTKGEPFRGTGERLTNLRERK
jgi:hypothetical protein